jgi:PAS domain S-box-containing protein
MSLRFLHLEDNPMDAELVAVTLSSEGVDCELVRASSRDQFVEALDHASYDLILSDYSLPGFDGLTAYAIVRGRRLDVPFIFVTGTMGEEVAIDCLKNGATDYVLKHRLTRLVPAVRRAIDESRNRRERAAAEEEIRRLNTALQVALGQANTFLDSIFENLPDLVFVKDARDLRFVRLNRASQATLGVDRTELLGRTISDVFPPSVAKIYEAADRSAIGGGVVVEIPEEIVPTRTRGPRVFSTKKIPIRDADGEIRYLLDISQDITERRTAEESARLSKLEAERANRAKSEFLSRMSHDLRTPLNAVLGFAQLLEFDLLPPEQADSLQQILRGGRHLLELINEVLDIARIESGHLSLSLEPVSVAEVIRHAADLIHSLASARGISVHVDVETVATRFIRADRQRIRQVLLNFLGNAVKYNREKGSVLVKATAESGDRIRIAITDTGAGIPQDKLALLFQPFERLGADLGPVEGTGLGLAVAKGLTEAMGGRIGVTSTVDHGTTFWVELPEVAGLEAAAAAEPVTVILAATPSAEPEGTILYVEDNHSNVRLLERLLGRRRAIRLITASRGIDGIELAMREQPDLILLDLHLPDLPGEEVLRRLWADPRTRPLPVAVLSADATPAQRQRLLAAGAVEYLTKPLDINQLLRLVDERLHSTAGRDT